MQGKFLDFDLFHQLAEKYGKSPSQIVLRWHLQLGRVALPKSITPSRIQENFNVFDFKLSSEDMDAIAKLATNVRMGPDPDEIQF